MKTRFVSTVSHELRTPLTVINLHTENLIEFYERLSDEDRKKILRDIHSETKILHQLIEDLLCLSRLDSNRSEPRFNQVNLSSLLKDAITSAHFLAIEKEIELSCQLPDEGLTMLGDYDQISQVFRNILSNSIKFTPARGQVHLDTRQEDHQVVFAVTDTGIGIPEPDMPRLFERFFRSELSVQLEIPGSGLGLAICNEIIQRHQGRIEVQSQVGKGSTFWIYLPLAE
jgi:signal transduction histidine kinase